MIAYLITNAVNGKRYVGITSRNLSIRWKAHLAESRNPTNQKPLYVAIRELGADAFSVEHVASARAWKDLIAVEKAIIKQERTVAPDGYNLTHGGQGSFGVKLPPERIAQLVKQSTGFKHSEVTKKKLSELRSSIIGWSHTPETKAKISNSNAGKERTPEHCASLSVAASARKRKPHSEATKAKMSASAKVNALVSPRLGWHHSEATKAKMSASGRVAHATNPRNLGPPSAETRAKMSASMKAYQARTQITALVKEF